MPTVLIVDDAVFMRNMLRKLIEKANYEVVGEAASGKEAIAQYALLQPDAVTMDLSMPEIDGVAAIREIKKRFPAARIIVCSAMGQQSMVIEAIRAGASDFIVKPFTEESILQALHKLLQIPPSS